MVTLVGHRAQRPGVGNSPGELVCRVAPGVSGSAGSFDPKPGGPMLSRLSIANRCAVGVVPREPFIQWVQQVLGHESTAIRALEPLLFLIPCYRDQEEALEILEDEFGEIFCIQLLFWCTDLRKWPRRRTFDLFLEWFDVRTYSMVGDLAEYPLGSEEFNEYFLRKVLASSEERSSCSVKVRSKRSSWP